MYREGLLAGKVALVTGGASGIGRAIAVSFARAGASVVVVDLNATGGHEVVAEIDAAGAAASFVQADVSRTEDARAAVVAARSRFGRLDILVNNAGIIRRASVTETSEEDWDRVMAVNVKSAFLFSKHALPAIAASGAGVVINIASGWGLVGGRRAAALLCVEGCPRPTHPCDGPRSRA